MFKRHLNWILVGLSAIVFLSFQNCGNKFEASKSLVSARTGGPGSNGVVPNSNNNSNNNNSNYDTPLKSLPIRLYSLSIFDSDQKVKPEARSYSPNYPLYVNGTSKRSWFFIPTNSNINTADMENWIFPLGTILVKEFSLRGEVVETRVMLKTNSSAPKSVDNWEFGVYLSQGSGLGPQLRDDTSDEETPFSNGSGMVDHIAPKRSQCIVCHGSDSDSDGVIGFSAFQLDQVSATGETFLNLSELMQGNLLSDPPSNSTPDFGIKGSVEDQRILGYLHGNCAHCHNGLSGLFNMKHNLSANSLEQESAYKNVLLGSRVVPGDHGNSGLYDRITREPGHFGFMPKFGVQVKDVQYASDLAAWIDGLSSDN